MNFRKLPPHEVARNYKHVELSGLEKPELVMAIYETIITQFRRAIRAIENKEVTIRNEAVSNALDLIGELRQSLDFHKAEQLATDLERFYLAATQKLLRAHRHGDRALFHELASEFESVLGSFKEAMGS